MPAVADQIKKAANIETLLRIHSTHPSSLNYIHLTACWITLSRLSKQKVEERQWLRTHAQALVPLTQQTVEAARAAELDARQLASILYGAARSGNRQSLGILFTVLARAAEHRASEFKSQELANIAWAFATASKVDAAFFIALFKAAVWRACDFKQQEIANSVWALATTLSTCEEAEADRHEPVTGTSCE